MLCSSTAFCIAAPSVTSTSHIPRSALTSWSHRCTSCGTLRNDAVDIGSAAIALLLVGRHRAKRRILRRSWDVRGVGEGSRGHAEGNEVEESVHFREMRVGEDAWVEMTSSLKLQGSRMGGWGLIWVEEPSMQSSGFKDEPRPGRTNRISDHMTCETVVVRLPSYPKNAEADRHRLRPARLPVVQSSLDCLN